MSGIIRWAKKHSGIIGVITGIVGTILGLAGLAVAYLSWSGSYDIARRSGAFERGDARLFYAKMELKPGEVTETAYLMDFKKASLSICNLSLAVGNAGDRTLKGNYLTLRVPNNLVIPTELLNLEIFSRRAVLQQIIRNTSRAGNLAYVVYELPNIDPGRGISIEEPLLCNKTKVQDQIEVQTKDSARMRVSYSVDYSYQVLVSISGEDQRTKNYEINIAGVQRQSSDTPVAISLIQFENNRAYQRRRDYSFFSYLKGLMSNARQIFIMIAPETKIISEGDKIVQVPAENSQIASAKVPLFRIHYLFASSEPAQ